MSENPAPTTAMTKKGTPRIRFPANVSPVAVLNRRIRVMPSGCHQWVGCHNPGGYGQTSVGGEQWLAHRLAFHVYVGPIPKDLCVCHHCDNRLCCNVEHMFLGAQLDNVNDCLLKGKLKHPPRGEKSAPLPTKDQCIEIINRIDRGEPSAQIAAALGVDKKYVYKVKSGDRCIRLRRELANQRALTTRGMA